MTPLQRADDCDPTANPAKSQEPKGSVFGALIFVALAISCTPAMFRSLAEGLPNSAIILCLAIATLLAGAYLAARGRKVWAFACFLLAYLIADVAAVTLPAEQSARSSRAAQSAVEAGVDSGRPTPPMARPGGE